MKIAGLRASGPTGGARFDGFFRLGIATRSRAVRRTVNRIRLPSSLAVTNSHLDTLRSRSSVKRSHPAAISFRLYELAGNVTFMPSSGAMQPEICRFGLICTAPFTPMRGVNVNSGSSLCVEPAAYKSSAHENERTWAVIVNDSKLKVQVVRCAIDELPRPKCALPCLPCAQHLSVFHQSCN
jgi:hypothetical protein